MPKRIGITEFIVNKTKFGRLVILADAVSSTEKRKVHCVCECGATCVTNLDSLRTGNTSSCGCLNRELKAAGFTRTHGYGSRAKDKRRAEYESWTGMWQRCTNQNNKHFKDYGGRGVQVCERWKSFENFIADMGDKPTGSHSLDRVNVEGHYEPGNCRWATPAEQARNTRRTRLLTLNGKTQCLQDWATELGFGKARVITRRLAAGWSIERALSPQKFNQASKAKLLAEAS